MKTARIIAILALFCAVIAVLLWRNKEEMEAKASAPIALVPTVRTVTAEALALSESLVARGTIQAQNEVTVISETQGRATHVYVKLGDRVSAGTALVKVDTALKYSAYIAAKANFEKAKRDAERMSELRREQNASEAEAEGAELQYQNAKAQFIAAERQLRDARITSPIAGTVVERPVNVGTMILPGAPVATVVDVQSLKLRANVSEQDVLKLRVGEKVIVQADVYPDVSFEGAIAFIGLKADALHNYPVEITLKNSATHQLKAGMSAQIVFKSPPARPALLIPRLAVVGGVKNPAVYAVDSSGGVAVARLKSISVGAERGEYIEVLSGLQSGERIVAGGLNNVKNGGEIVVK
jgi:RND family efflux transporter MFP subunit